MDGGGAVRGGQGERKSSQLLCCLRHWKAIGHTPFFPLSDQRVCIWMPLITAIGSGSQTQNRFGTKGLKTPTNILLCCLTHSETQVN